MTAEVEVWVRRDAVGDLPSGVRAVLEDVPGVERAEVTAVTGVTPRSTDIRVTASADLELRESAVERSGDAVTAALADGFGVLEATVERLERA